VEKDKEACQPKDNLNFALRILREHNLKITVLRKLILTFLTSSHGPFTIENIYENTHKIKACNLTTIYRIIAQLEELGLVRRSELGDGLSRYEYQCVDHPHHHLVCRSCKKVVPIETSVFPDVEKVAKKQGFKKVYPYFEIFGLCRSCFD